MIREKVVVPVSYSLTPPTLPALPLAGLKTTADSLAFPRHTARSLPCLFHASHRSSIKGIGTGAELHGFAHKFRSDLTLMRGKYLLGQTKRTSERFKHLKMFK